MTMYKKSAVLFLLLALSGAGSAQDEQTPAKPRYRPDRELGTWKAIGRIQSAAVCESSGLVRSRQHEGIYWTLNDSGNPAEIFAIRLNGEVVARVPIEGARNRDWEDITIDDKGFLYIGDIGDNWGRYPHHTIYKVPEPDPFAEETKPVKPVATWTYEYPDLRRDAESLFLFRGDLYVITKGRRAPCTLFRLTSEGAEEGTLRAERICEPKLWSATATDVSPDGKRIAILAYARLWVYAVGDNLTDLERIEPLTVSFPTNSQTEACAFDGEDVIVTSEERDIFRITREDIAQGRRLIPPRKESASEP
jgi:hypothetical protein